MQEFLGKERIAFTLGREERTDRWTERAAKDVKSKSLDVLGREWLDRDGRENALPGEFSETACERSMPIEFAVAVRSHQQHMGMCVAACQVAEQVQARCIGPLQIIEEEDEHMGQTNGLHEGSHRFIETKAGLLRRQKLGSGKLSEAENQLWEDAGEHWRGGGHLLTESVQGSVLDVSAKCFDKREIGRHP